LDEILENFEDEAAVEANDTIEGSDKFEPLDYSTFL